MDKVIVYRYRRPYDSRTDSQPVADRMATREFIEGQKVLTVIEGTGIEVDSSLLNKAGQTELGFAARGMESWMCEICHQVVERRSDGSLLRPISAYENCLLKNRYVGECIAYRQLDLAREILSEMGNEEALRQRGGGPRGARHEVFEPPQS
jgi:hypothetical protein